MKKVLSIMLVTLMLISTMLTATIFAASERIVIRSSRTDSESDFYILNGYDGYSFTEWTSLSSNGTTNSTYHGLSLNSNYLVLDGYDFKTNDNSEYVFGTTAVSKLSYGKKSLYMKLDLSDFSNKNIDSAYFFSGQQTSITNSKCTLYVFDDDIWNNTTAPIINRESYTENNGKYSVDFKAAWYNSGNYMTDEQETAEGLLANTGGMHSKVDITAAVNYAVNAGYTSLCMVLDAPNNVVGGMYANPSGISLPQIQINTSPKSGVVSLSADKASYSTTDTSAVITANVTNATPSSYTFTVNNTAINELTGMTGNVAGNVLTLSNLTAGTHTIKVECAAPNVDNFTDEISITVVDQANVTPTAIEIESLNGYDGKLFSEWNQSTGGYTATGTSFAFDGRTDKRKSVFMRIPLANIKTANIKSARLLVGYAGGFNNTTINVYTFDEGLWSTTTAPTVTRTADNKMYYTSTRANITSATDSDFESGWSYYEIIDDAKLNANSAFTMTEAVKNAIKAGDDYLCLVIEPNGTSYGTFYASDAGKPRLQAYISDNDIPVASLSITDSKAYYETTDSIVLNASATDNHSADGFVYEYYLDESDTPIAGADTAAPSIALTGLSGGQHKITVKITDKYGDSGEASVTFEVLGAVVKTPNTVDVEVLNGYDGFLFAKWNNASGFKHDGGSWAHLSEGSYYLDGNSFTKKDGTTKVTAEEMDTDTERDALVAENEIIAFGKKSVYMKVDVNQFASQNVSNSRLLIGINANLRGTLNIYTFDEDKWSTERAPIVDRTTKAIEYATGDVATLTDPDFDSSWNEYKEAIDLTDLVKKTIANGDQYLCFVLEPNGTQAGTFWKSENNKARIQVYTTTNNVPTVSLAADKTFYDGTTPAVITATANDADAWDTTLTHTFYINGVEVNQDYQGASVADNKLTIATYDGSDMEIIVKSSDSKDYGLAILNLKKNMNFEINEPAVTGTIGSTDLTTIYTVTNKNTTNSLNLVVIVAAYDADGKLVGVNVDSTQSVGANTTASLTAVTLQNANITGGTPVKAVSMIWDKDTFAPLRAATDF